MNCQLCGAATRVLVTDGPKRRRECMNCRHRFNTEEVRAEVLGGRVALDEAMRAYIKITGGVREGVL